MKTKQIFAFLVICIISFSCKSQRKVSNEDDKIAAIIKKINRYSQKNKLHGSMLIAFNNEIELQQAFGENTHGSKNRIESFFDMASIGKMFTGIAIAQLESKGKLRYSDKLSTFLIDSLENNSFKEITISHLLTHSSGIPDIFNLRFIHKILEKNSLTMDDYFDHFKKNPYSTKFFKTLPLDFEPGTKFNYSNSGYLILGRVIEKVTGLKYSDYVEQNILNPLGMHDTKLVSSYGGGPSTLRDMFSLYIGLIGNSLIDEQSFSLISSGKIKMGKNKYYAYGFEDDRRYNSKIITHKGGTSESKAQFIMFPQTNYFVIIYANNNNQGYEEFHNLRDFIRKTLS